MRFQVKQLKGFIPGLFVAMIVITTSAVLLLLSLDTNDPPHAHISSSSEMVEVGEPVFFDGRGSTDPEGDDLSYKWTINETMFNEQSCFYYSFPTPGNFTVVLKVEDSSGNIDTETVIIDVARS
jgi:hypothetical protein